MNDDMTTDILDDWPFRLHTRKPSTFPQMLAVPIPMTNWPLVFFQPIGSRFNNVDVAAEIF